MRPTPFLRAAAAAAIGTAALAAVAQAPPAPTACDALRLRIEERIRANGVREPRVTVVEAAASAPGQVVGTCEQGAKKVMYEREGGSARPTPAPVITECKDGTVMRDGAGCRKP